jgi:predicted metal-dependent HD superfamily phosphohydrolase
MSGIDLRSEWTALWNRLGAKGDGVLPFDDLISRYAEPHRAYHTITHIETCLSELADIPDAIQFAIWYHDAIYDPQAKDNEERSADLAAQVAGLSDEFIHSVRRLILSTKHSVQPTQPDEQILVDIDLAILGQPELAFDEYERQIRFEYSWVPDEMFAKGRCAVLASFLSRPTIYSTDAFRAKYEKRARQNLAHSIAALS